uniref:Uncharacterized protein n=1 Tax=Knipowitschia caucasica TaxID=637954 RepID=A0AAV2LY42_KNICA
MRLCGRKAFTLKCQDWVGGLILCDRRSHMPHSYFHYVRGHRVKHQLILSLYVSAIYFSDSGKGPPLGYFHRKNITRRIRGAVCYLHPQHDFRLWWNDDWGLVWQLSDSFVAWGSASGCDPLAVNKGSGPDSPLRCWHGGLECQETRVAAQLGQTLRPVEHWLQVLPPTELPPLLGPQQQGESKILRPLKPLGTPPLSVSSPPTVHTNGPTLWVPLKGCAYRPALGSCSLASWSPSRLLVVGKLCLNF